MPSKRRIHLVLASLLFGLSQLALAQSPTQPAQGPVRPKELLRQVVTGMPIDSAQEIRVITATFRPSDTTVFHTHARPVTVYVLEGTFTLEMEGRKPVVVHAGEAMVEPPNVRMTGRNRSTNERTRVVVFYVSEPGAPFLHQISSAR